MTADWGYENTKIDHLHYDFIRAKTSGSCSRPTKTGPCEPKKHGPYLAMVVLPKYSDLKPATHLAILYAESPRSAKIARCARLRLRFSPIAGIGVYNRRYLTFPISAIKFASIRQVGPFLRFSTLIAANRR